MVHVVFNAYSLHAGGILIGVHACRKFIDINRLLLYQCFNINHVGMNAGEINNDSSDDSSVSSENDNPEEVLYL